VWKPANDVERALIEIEDHASFADSAAGLTFLLSGIVYGLLTVIVVSCTGIDAVGLSRQTSTIHVFLNTPLWIIFGIVLPMVAVPVYLAVRERYVVKYGLL